MYLLVKKGMLHLIHIHLIFVHSSILSNAVQIPGFKGMQNTTSTVLTQLKGLGQKFANWILVDEKHFPQHSQRFTAVYSRDKEYL